MYPQGNDKSTRRLQEKHTLPYKILIVEDNDNNGTLLSDLLIYHGYEVAMASNGQKGVNLARELLPDLILMDIQMPGLDGMSACSILKRDPPTSRLKIIALTAFAMQGDQEKFLAAGFDGYLSKPLRIRELPIRVDRWLKRES